MEKKDFCERKLVYTVPELEFMHATEKDVISTSDDGEWDEVRARNYSANGALYSL